MYIALVVLQFSHSTVMVNTNPNIFGMLPVEGKLNGDNYPCGPYMMRHVLMAKNVWVLADSTEECPVSTTSTKGEIIEPLGDLTPRHPPPLTLHWKKT